MKALPIARLSPGAPLEMVRCITLAMFMLAVSSASGFATYASPPTCEYGWSVCKKCVEFESDGQGGSRCTKCAVDINCMRFKRRLGGGGMSADALAILNAHNGYRAKHCVPNLTWSAQLAAGAQQWASGCKYGHSGTSGENIAWSRPTLSPTKPVDSWYSEIGQYDFNNPIGSYKTGKVLHFTQVVWRGSTQLGCGIATCQTPAPDGANSGWGFIVCRYAPPGNFNGENPGVLDTNVPRPCK